MLSGSRKLISRIIFTGLYHKFTGDRSVGCAVQLNRGGISCGSIPASGQHDESIIFSRFFYRNTGVYNARSGTVIELPVKVSINGLPCH